MTPWIIDKRATWLRVWAMQEARSIVRDQLKRKNMKPSHFCQAEISKMALNYLNDGHWQELRQHAFERIMGEPRLKAEWIALGAKFEAQMAKRDRALCVLPRTYI
jgi:hypothetical protein